MPPAPGGGRLLKKGPYIVSHPAPLPPSATSWSLDDIGRLASVTGNAAETLSNVVQLIQRRFGTDVCSVYLLGPDRSNLILAATIGLKPDSVGRIRMRLDEGLVGLVAEALQPLIVDDAPAHPRFKYFKDAGEDPYRSFLGVPLIDRGLLQGVLVVQTVTPGPSIRRWSRRSAAPGTSCRTSSAWPAPRASSSPRPRNASAGWPATCGGAGTRTRPACSATSTRSCGAGSDTTRSRCCSRCR